MHCDIEEVVYTEEEIARRIRELGQQITEDYADIAQGESIVFIITLRGAIIFGADLARSIKLPLEMDCIGVSSYGNDVKSSGNVQVVKDLSASIEGRHVIVVEDIIDSGKTLEFLIPYLEQHNPASIRVAALLKKHVEDQKDVQCQYVAFDCPNAFIVGYGLDYAQRYRNIGYIGILKPEVYQ